MLIICAEGTPAFSGTNVLRRNTGATFHCCPLAVTTVTVLRLYFEIMPVITGCPSWLKRHAFADTEIEHVCVRAHLLQESQARDDAVVEIDEFGFGQFVDVYRHWGEHLSSAAAEGGPLRRRVRHSHDVP